jgi:hypothetical protein
MTMIKWLALATLGVSLVTSSASATTYPPTITAQFHENAGPTLVGYSGRRYYDRYDHDYDGDFGIHFGLGVPFVAPVYPYPYPYDYEYDYGYDDGYYGRGCVGRLRCEDPNRSAREQ